MKTWIVKIILSILVISSGLWAQTTEEGPGRRGRVVDFNALGEADVLEEYLATGNWLVRLNASANYVQNQRLTYVLNIQNTDGDKNFLGVRVNFPNFPNNAHAKVRPPLSFPFYGGEDLGVLRNVGDIKSVIARVAGRNFPYSISLNLRHSEGGRMHVPLGHLEFLGWRDLQYDNPHYIENVRNRSLAIRPAYPRIIPSVRLEDLVFFRNGEATTSGNFVSYVAWVDVIYDNAFSAIELEELRQSEDYVDDDAFWKIQSDEIGVLEAKIFSEKIERYQYLERLERDKMNLPPLNVTPQAAPPPATGAQ